MSESVTPQVYVADRLHALDAVRAFALLLGIALHATIPWVGIRSTTVGAESQSSVLITVFHVIHMFRMPIFFLIAGFFGRLMLERRGTKAFIRDRFKRIALPLIVGLPVVLLLSGMAILLGTLASGRGLPDLSRPPAGSDGEPRYILMHLWFLYYLIYFYASALVVRAVLNRFMDRDGRLRLALDAIARFLMRGIWGPVLLAVPLFGAFALKGWGGHPGPPALLTPDWGALAVYGTVFGFGWLLHRQRDLILDLQEHWPRYIAVAMVMTVASAWIVTAGRRGALLANGNELLVNSTALEGRTLLLHAAAYTVGTWFWMFGLVGAAVRYLSSPSPIRRYLADSSYWLYLMHVPALYFFEQLFMPFSWHWSVKYVLSIAGSIPILLLSYHYLVRTTFIGATLNGRRRLRTLAGEPASA